MSVVFVNNNVCVSVWNPDHLFRSHVQCMTSGIVFARYGQLGKEPSGPLWLLFCKLKVHILINNWILDRSHLARSHHGDRSLRSIGWTFKSYRIQSRPEKALVCANEKLLWNRAECFCKERNVSSIPRWNTYCHASGLKPANKALRSTSGNQTTQCRLHLH